MISLEAVLSSLILNLVLAQEDFPKDFFELKIEKMAGGFRFADGPVWTPDRRLLFSELPSNTIYVWNPGQKVEPLRGNSNGTQSITYDNQERVYSCESKSRRLVRLDKKGRMEVLAERWEGKRLNGPNDVVVRKDGNVYFTDSVFGSAVENRELDFNGIFRIGPKGEYQAIAKWKGRPNGIAISPAGNRLYVTNSDERTIVEFDLDKAGVATNERVLAKGLHGVPGGIRCDVKGNLYVAAAGISIHGPDGKLIREVELADGPSNLAFGENDLQSLFVTTRHSLFRIRVPFKGWVPYLTPAGPSLPQQIGGE
jgi:sugar lactone lactonase YvrE